MTTRYRVMRAAGVALFSVGILVGMALAGGAAWADIEARFYGFPKMADRPLRGVQCPILMTTHETGVVSATFKNRSQQPLQLLVRADISSPGPWTVERTRLSLAPGESQTQRWTVSSENIDLGFFIFVRVANYPAYPFSFRETMCGILVLNLQGLTGNQVLNIALAVSLVCIPLGLALWEATQQRPLKGRARQTTLAMAFLAGIVLVGMLASFVGAWAAGGLSVLLAVLVISVIAVFVATD
jgi:hypothetical protein